MTAIPPRPAEFHPEVPPPGFELNLISFWQERPIITPRLQLVHTNGASREGSVESSKSWAERRGGNTIPHCQIDRSGRGALLLPSNRKGIANYKAADFSLGFETADTGYLADPTISAFTDAQAESVAVAFAYYAVLHGIPLAYPPAWDGAGTASHTEPFGYPYWTNSNGKIPLALDTIVPTPRGSRPLADIKIDDSVFDENGHPCRVIDTTEVWPDDAYTIEWDDGTVIVAAGSHPWSGLSRGQLYSWARNRKMIDGARANQAQRLRSDSQWAGRAQTISTADLTTSFMVPVVHEVDGCERELPIDPYLLGLWLGDGGTRDGTMCAGSDDIAETEATFIAGGYPTGERVVRIGGTVVWRPLGLERALRLLGVLGNKHIPVNYLTASALQRAALLAGLLDSDGHISGRNRVEFTNKNEGLSDAVGYLAASLGQKPRITKRSAMLNGVDYGPVYRVQFRATRQLFQLSRKAVRWVDDGGSLRANHRKIVAVRPHTIVPMRCLTVDSEHSLFCVTESFIPTHNCPGLKKKAQVRDVILPRAREIFAAWTVPPPPPTPPPPVVIPQGVLDMVIVARDTTGPTIWFSPNGGLTRHAIRNMEQLNFLLKPGAIDAATGNRVTTWQQCTPLTPAQLDHYIGPNG